MSFKDRKLLLRSSLLPLRGSQRLLRLLEPTCRGLRYDISEPLRVRTVSFMDGDLDLIQHGSSPVPSCPCPHDRAPPRAAARRPIAGHKQARCQRLASVKCLKSQRELLPSGVLPLTVSRE